MREITLSPNSLESVVFNDEEQEKGNLDQRAAEVRPGRRHNPDGAGPWNDPSHSHRQLCKFSAGTMESTSGGVDSRPAREAVWKKCEGVGE